jgi:hypothetical protein
MFRQKFWGTLLLSVPTLGLMILHISCVFLASSDQT